MQIALAIPQSFERAHGFDDIIAIGAGSAVPLPHVMQTLGERQPAGILHMAAINDVADRPHAAPHMILKLDLPQVSR